MALLDAEEAIWLAELIGQTVYELPHQPGLTVEIIDTPEYWVQLIPTESEREEGTLAGFLLNFPYREHTGDPLHLLGTLGLPPPPQTSSHQWEENHFATLRLSPDVPLIGLAHFIGDILERVVGASPSAEVQAHIDYGY